MLFDDALLVPMPAPAPAPAPAPPLIAPALVEPRMTKVGLSSETFLHAAGGEKEGEEVEDEDTFGGFVAAFPPTPGHDTPAFASATEATTPISLPSLSIPVEGEGLMSPQAARFLDSLPDFRHFTQ